MSAFAFTIESREAKPLNLKHLESQFSPTADDASHGYNPFHVRSLHNYQPIYRLFFDINSTSLQLNHRYQISDLCTVLDTSTNTLIQKPIFIKHSPLLDPIRFMLGKYDTANDAIRTLPSPDSTKPGFDKLATTNNASYTDGFFYFLSSKVLEGYGFPHAVDYYGAYLAVQDKFKMNIADDYEYLSTSDFFLNNVGKLFKVNRHRVTSMSNCNSRGNKERLQISDVDVNADIDVLNVDTIDVSTSGELEEVYSKVVEIEKSDDEEEDDSDEEDEEEEEDEEGEDDEEDDEGDGEDEDGEDGEDEDEDDEEGEGEEDDDEGDDDDDEEDTNIFAYIDNFPMHMICLEQCDGTLDELFVNEDIDDETGASALFQVIMTLITYQKMFHFTHNDLHTNNIMYVKTDIEYLYYKFDKITYKVPTYGRIFKMIDFGRSIYTVKGKLFCSDSFAVGGDAATQYNFEPYYNEKYPRLDPNYSFDLCRLGCSIYDFVKPKTELCKTIHRWCQDDKKLNVIYKKNGDERYPDFKLYKMIAKTVHLHTPQNQLKFPFFEQFKSKIPKKANILDIDAMPCYA